MGGYECLCTRARVCMCVQVHIYVWFLVDLGYAYVYVSVCVCPYRARTYLHGNHKFFPTSIKCIKCQIRFILTILGYLMPNPFIHIYQIYMICFGWVLWHINHCRLFNAESFFTCISNIYEYVWFGFVLWHINHCRLFNAKFFYAYIWNIYDLVWLGFMAYQPM